jgi:uncharacterized protein YbjQ (UPF0145 family)
LTPVVTTCARAIRDEARLHHARELYLRRIEKAARSLGEDAVLVELDHST